MFSRLQTVEHDLQNHAKTLSEYNAFMAAMQKQIEDLREWRQEQRMNDVRQEERDKALNAVLDNIRNSMTGMAARIDGIGSTWTRILWIAATPIITAIVVGVSMVVVYGVRLASGTA